MFGIRTIGGESLAERLASCALDAAAIESGLTEASLKPAAAHLAATLREVAEQQSSREEAARRQRSAAGKARAAKDERRTGEWRALALRHARRVRLADPEIGQGRLADMLIAALPGRLPQRDAVIKIIRGWESAGDLKRGARAGAGRIAEAQSRGVSK